MIDCGYNSCLQDDPKMELHDINQKLQEEGMDACSSDEQKISYLWQLYIKTEVCMLCSTCKLLICNFSNESFKIVNIYESIQKVR